MQEREVVDAGLGVAVMHADLGRTRRPGLRAGGAARESAPAGRRRGSRARAPRWRRGRRFRARWRCPSARRTPAPMRSPCHARRAGTRCRRGAHRRGPPEQGRHGDAERVLQHHEHRDGDEQDDERPPAGLEVADARVDADGREEVDEQHVARGQLEGDPVTGGEEDSQNTAANNRPARDRLGDVVFAERREAPVKRLADEKHDDPGGDREERAHEQRRHPAGARPSPSRADVVHTAAEYAPRSRAALPAGTGAPRGGQSIRSYAGSVRNSTYSPVVISSKSLRRSARTCRRRQASAPRSAS